jgi:CheY-like chemotaxis protein
MPRGGRVTVETQNVVLDESYAARHSEVQPGRYALIAVSDTGHGMDDQTKSRIFEPFFTTKEVGKGTGLGLATVYGIVKQTEGHIAVYSELNRGTAFKVYLPCLPVPAEVAGNNASETQIPKGTETILLVEDEDAVRSLASLVLQANGYSVLDARNGEEALQVCQQYNGVVHLLVTDVVMPKMSGRELADLIAVTYPTIQVLFLSGYTDDAVIRHGVLRSGAAFLQKPFTPRALAVKVREVLDAGANNSAAIVF